MLHEGGRPRFLAPELSGGATERFRTTQGSDIFALAMTFLNTWTQQAPFAEIRNDHKVAAALRKGRRPKRPTTRAVLSPKVEYEFWALLTDMWAHEPSARPTSRLIKERAENIFVLLL